MSLVAVQPLRHRRGDRHRRRLHQLDLMHARRRRPVPARVRAALPREGLLAGQVAGARNSRVVFARFADRIALIDGERQYTYARHRPAEQISLALNLLDARPEAARPRRARAAERRRVRDPLLRAAEDRRDPDRRAGHAPLRRDQPVRADLPGRPRASIPERQGDFEFEPMIAARAGGEPVACKFCISASARCATLIEREPAVPGAALRRDPHRPDRPVHLPALGRHDRHARS